MPSPHSFWHDTLLPGDDLVPRPALPGDATADVAIIGAGFTGLWTAYELLRADPSLRVTILERDTAGFGASGRNGGWCVGDYGGPLRAVERAHGKGSAEAMAREMHRAVDEVGAVIEREGIDCGWKKGGALFVARDKAQLAHVRRRQRQSERYGFADAWTPLDGPATEAIVRATGTVGGLMTPHAAALHPARLARGLAEAVERMGGTVHEGTAVTSIDGRTVHTEHGTVRGDVVVLATEAYTSTIAGHRRDMVPLGNAVIATEPIDDASWREIGLANRELFEISCNLLGYGQRTADDRIVWGGYGALSYWGSRVPKSPMHHARIEARLARVLVELFPVLKGIGVSHRWGGILGVPRDLLPRVGYDRETGFAFGGGYTGQGVAAANAAGRALSDLIRGVDSDLTKLPWIGPRSRRWEPEPIRTLGVKTATTAAHIKDAIDRRRG